MTGARTNRTNDRVLMLELVAALLVSLGNLRRDECADWVLVGRRGHISTDGTSLFVFLPSGTVRRWESAKRALNFTTVTIDGDDEGVLRLPGLPTPDQAELLRKYVGLRKSTLLTADRREALREAGRGFNFSGAKTTVRATSIGFGEVPATSPHPDQLLPETWHEC